MKRIKILAVVAVLSLSLSFVSETKALTWYLSQWWNGWSITVVVETYDARWSHGSAIYTWWAQYDGGANRQNWSYNRGYSPWDKGYYFRPWTGGGDIYP